MSPEFVKATNEDFAKGRRAIYPFCRSIIKTKQIPKGAHVAQFDNVFTNVLPTNIMAVMVKSSAYGGSIQENPFLFNHYNVNHINFKVNGEITPPGGLDCVFKGKVKPGAAPDDATKVAKNSQDQEKSLYRNMYRRLFDHTGINTENTTNGITPELFLNGCTIFPHDYSPDRCLGQHEHKPTTGKFDVQFNFDEPLPEGITILVLGSYDEELVMDGSRNVVYDE